VSTADGGSGPDNTLNFVNTIGELRRWLEEAKSRMADDQDQARQGGSNRAHKQGGRPSSWYMDGEW
jgi:hypothetical protein